MTDEKFDSLRTVRNPIRIHFDAATASGLSGRGRAKGGEAWGAGAATAGAHSCGINALRPQHKKVRGEGAILLASEWSE